MIQVYHNTRCSKSRECLAVLDAAAVSYEIVEYLKDAPSVGELKTLTQKLGIKPAQLVRTKEPLWIEKYKDRKLLPSQILKLLAKNPILIERPIVVNGDRAVIARPPENALTVL